MSQGDLVQGKVACGKIVDQHVGAIKILLNLKCSDIATKILREKNFDGEPDHPDLLFTAPDGVVTVDVDILADKAYEFYKTFVKDGRAFTDLYGTMIEMVKYIDKITVEEV